MNSFKIDSYGMRLHIDKWRTAGKKATAGIRKAKQHGKLIACIPFLLIAGHVSASNYEWTGADDAFWSNKDNWEVNGSIPAAPPTASDDAVLDADNTLYDFMVCQQNIEANSVELRNMQMWHTDELMEFQEMTISGDKNASDVILSVLFLNYYEDENIDTPELDMYDDYDPGTMIIGSGQNQYGYCIQNVNSFFDAGTLILGQSGGNGYMTMNGGELDVWKMRVGASASASGEASGVFTQNNGNIQGRIPHYQIQMPTLIIGVETDSEGIYNINNGSLDIGYITIGDEGSGQFSHNNGTVNSGTMRIGNNPDSFGNYIIEDGNLSAGSITIGHDYDGDTPGIKDSALTIHDGSGTIDVSNYIRVNDTGLIHADRDTTFSYRVNVNDTGVIQMFIQGQSTEIHSLYVEDDAADQAKLNLNGSSALRAGALYVGSTQSKTGQVSQESQSTATLGDLILGNSAGSQGYYELGSEDNELEITQTDSPDLVVGLNGYGEFTHTDGTATIWNDDDGTPYGLLMVGYGSTGSGLHTFSDGELITRDIYIGYDGIGKFSWESSSAQISMTNLMVVNPDSTLAMGWDFNIQTLLGLPGSNYFNGYDGNNAGYLLMTGNSILEVTNQATGTSDVAYDPNYNVLISDGSLQAYSANWLDISIEDDHQLTVYEGDIECNSFALGSASDSGSLSFTGALDASDEITGKLCVHKDVIINSTAIIEAYDADNNNNADGAYIVCMKRQGNDTDLDNDGIEDSSEMGYFTNHVTSTNASNIDFQDLKLVCEFDPNDTVTSGINTINIEVCGSIGASGYESAVFNSPVTNFVIDHLVVGRSVDDSGNPISDTAGGIKLRLVNNIDNGNGGSGFDANSDANEAMYVKTLEILPGAAIDIADQGSFDLFYLRTPGEMSDNFRQFFPGDLNLDGTVNLDDFIILKANYGIPGADWSTGDIDGDRDVDLDDFILLKVNYGKTTPVQN